MANQNLKQIFAGAVLAPAIGVAVFTFSLCGLALTPLISDVPNCSETVSFFGFYGLFLSYPFAFLIGVPILLFLLWRKWLAWWQFTLSGALAGIVTAMVLSVLESQPNWLAFSVLFIPVAAVTALSFWAIGISREP